MRYLEMRDRPLEFPCAALKSAEDRVQGHPVTAVVQCVLDYGAGFAEAVTRCRGHGLADCPGG